MATQVDVSEAECAGRFTAAALDSHLLWYCTYQIERMNIP